jgi:anti-anti-sigma regulatory factor
MDSFSFTVEKGFGILKLRGDIKVGLLPRLSPALADHISAHAQQDLVLDFTEATALDTSVAKLLSNIEKRLAANGKKLYLLPVPETVAPLLKTVGLTEIIDDVHELERDMNEDQYRKFLPFSGEELDIRRLQCVCGVCGSKNVVGYLLDQNAYSWSWEQDDFFPACSHRSGEKFDYYATLPIVCLDCCMVSIDPRHFALADKNFTIAQPSALSELSKMHLTKSIMKRKKFLEPVVEAASPDFFRYPRSRNAALQLYLLADACGRTLALNKADSDPFSVGFANYCAIRFAEDEQKTELIGNCRTWLSQAFTEKKFKTHTDHAIAYFILFASELSLGKLREANLLMQELSSMMEKISYSSEGRSTVNSPLFWSEQVQAIWKKDIEKKSARLAK